MPDHVARRVLFSVKDAADVILGIQRVRESGLLAGAPEMEQSLVATIMSELATNIVKYAQRGVVWVQRVEHGPSVDIEVWAEDQGPGIPDIDRARSDHFSTGNTLGLGLPGVQRMADEFTIQSVVGHGTQVHARRRIIGRQGATRRADPGPAASDGAPAPLHSPQWEIGMHVRPMPGPRSSARISMSTPPSRSRRLIRTAPRPEYFTMLEPSSETMVAIIGRSMSEPSRSSASRCVRATAMRRSVWSAR